MESQGADPKKTPASYADFSQSEEQGGWLKTAVQFFAIPMLIVILAVGVYLGVSFMIGGGPTSTADFVEMLKSDTVTRRWHAAFELQARLRDGVPDEFRTESMRIALESALEKARGEKQDPPMMTVLTLSLLGRIGMPESIPAVRASLDDPHPWTRSHAIRVLGLLGDRESADRLRALTTHDDPGTRQAALEALARLEQTPEVPFYLSTETRALLLRALGDRAEDVRFTAALLLARAGEREAPLPVLRTMLDRSYLEKLVPAQDMDTRLTGVSRYALHSNIILKALVAVGRIDARDDPEVVAAIRKLTDSKSEGDPDVRSRAREVLAAWNLEQGA